MWRADAIFGAYASAIGAFARESIGIGVRSERLAANFDIIGDRIAVVVEVEKIGNGVAVGIGDRNAIDRADDVGTDDIWTTRVYGDFIAVFVEQWVAIFAVFDFAWAFDGVEYAVAVGVGVAEVGRAVAVGIGRALDGIGDRVAIGVEIEIVGRAVAIGIGIEEASFDDIGDRIAIGIGFRFVVFVAIIDATDVVAEKVIRIVNLIACRRDEYATRTFFDVSRRVASRRAFLAFRFEALADAVLRAADIRFAQIGARFDGDVAVIVAILEYAAGLARGDHALGARYGGWWLRLATR